MLPPHPWGLSSMPSSSSRSHSPGSVDRTPRQAELHKERLGTSLRLSSSKRVTPASDSDPTALPLGVSAHRLLVNLCVIHRSIEIKAEEHAPDLALVAVIGGSKPHVSLLNVHNWVINGFNIPRDCFQVKIFLLEDFITTWRHRHPTPPLLTKTVNGPGAYMPHHVSGSLLSVVPLRTMLGCPRNQPAPIQCFLNCPQSQWLIDNRCRVLMLMEPRVPCWSCLTLQLLDALVCGRTCHPTPY
jgi:hypothetical protein